MKACINICNFSISAYPRVKLLTGILLLVFSHSTLAQRIVLGGNPQGSQLYPISQAISSVVTNNSDLRVDVLPQGGSVLYPMMQTDEVDLALVNPMDALSALKGEDSYAGPSRGNGFPMVTVMLGSPIGLSLVSAANADIRSAADLAGQRVVADYGAFASAGLTAQVVLAAAGLDLNDVEVVTVSSYPEGVRAVIEGRAVASTGSVGSSIVRELEASRGARYLEVKNNFATNQVIKKLGAAFYPFRLEAGQPGVEEAIWVIAYDIPIVARPNLEDETVYNFVSAVWDNYAELGQIYNPLESWTPERFASTKAIIPYHPGAIRFYRDKGVWTDDIEAHNQSLIEDLQ
jgi:uncharacterized protein